MDTEIAAEMLRIRHSEIELEFNRCYVNLSTGGIEWKTGRAPPTPHKNITKTQRIFLKQLDNQEAQNIDFRIFRKRGFSSSEEAAKKAFRRLRRRLGEEQTTLAIGEISCFKTGKAGTYRYHCLSAVPLYVGALRKLLRELFSANELRRFLTRKSLYTSVSATLTHTSDTLIFHDAAAALYSHKLINRVFISHLQASHPRHRHSIERWGLQARLTHKTSLFARRPRSLSTHTDPPERKRLDWDHPIRYALWRLMEQGAVPPWTAQFAVKMTSDSPPVDVLFLDTEGHPKEAVVCAEDSQADTVGAALACLVQIQRAVLGINQDSTTTFHFVSSTGLARLNTGYLDLSVEQDRERALENLAPMRELRISVPGMGPMELLARTLLLIRGIPETRRRDYRRLYGLCVQALPESIQDVEYPRLLSKISNDLNIYPRNQLDRQHADIKAVLAECLDPSLRKTREAIRISREEVESALRRGPFDDTSTSTSDLYVEPYADLILPENKRNVSHKNKGTASDLFYRWLSHAQEEGGPTLPLLVLGAFGSGKSTLLTSLARHMLDTDSTIVPLLVPLRDLSGASSNRPLSQVLSEHLKQHWGVDIKQQGGKEPVQFMILCDGFDELNLYYVESGSRDWVSQCFRSLCELSKLPGVRMVISSRPILLMDVTRREFEGAWCPRLTLHPFDNNRVRDWCIRYQRNRSFVPVLDVAFLQKRGLLEVCRTPLILYMTAQIVETDNTAFGTARTYSRAEVYRRFIDWTVGGGYHRDRTKHLLPENYREVLRELAWAKTSTNKNYIDERKAIEHLRKRFGNELDRIPVGRNLLVAHMLQPVDGQGEQRLIEFTHSSLREYLNVEHLWNKLAPVRAGKSLSTEVWLALGPPFWTPAQIHLIRDLCSTATLEELRCLNQEMKAAANIHTYYTRFLPTKLEPKFVWGLPGRISALAPLAWGFLAAIHSALSGLGEPPTQGLDGQHLRALLLFLESFGGREGSQGLGRNTLLASLSGLYLKAESNLSGVDLGGADLSKSTLSGCDLTGTSLADANLHSASMEGVMLDGADLRGANIDHCLLSGATLKRTRMLATTLEHVNLKGADLSNAILTLSHLRSCDLTDVNWTGTQIRCPPGQTVSIETCSLDKAARNALGIS